MTMIAHPTRAALAVTAEGDAVVLHDPRTGSRHRLNSVARHIWELCDGSHDCETIACDVAARFTIAHAQARLDVEATVAAFREAGLIRTRGSNAREQDLLLWAVGRAAGTMSGGPPGGFAGVDWNALVQLALDHGVMPLLRECVIRCCPDDVPSLVRERLNAQYAANERAAEALLTELLEIVVDLAAHGIPALPLKGPSLARWLYGSAAMRQVGDLDIFVAAEHVDRLRSVLEQRGYQFQSRRRTDELAVRPGAYGAMCLDVQWALARPVFRFPLTFEQVLLRAANFEIRGTPIRLPRPEDYLVVLCAHASKHCWSSCVWIADIARFLRLEGQHLDWDRLLARSVATGGQRQVLLGLRVARDVLGAALPRAVNERVDACRALPPLVAEIRRQLFAPAEQRTFQGGFGVIRGSFFYMRTRERLRDRVPYAAELCRQLLNILVDRVRPNHHDRELVRLPQVLGFLYYIVRLTRVTCSSAAFRTRRERRCRPLRPRDHGDPARSTARPG